MERANRPVTIELPMPAAVALVLALAMSVGVAAPARAASAATLFRIFLRDGTSVVSYGEFARLDGQVVFSMPAGGPAEEPRLQVVTLPDATIDAFADHGTPARTIDVATAVTESTRTWARLAHVGVDMDDVAAQLEREGVTSFQASFDDLLGALSVKAASFRT